jgi:hypothetical protein
MLLGHEYKIPQAVVKTDFSLVMEVAAPRLTDDVSATVRNFERITQARRLCYSQL